MYFFLCVRWPGLPGLAAVSHLTHETRVSQSLGGSLTVKVSPTKRENVIKRRLIIRGGGTSEGPEPGGKQGVICGS